MDQKLYEATIEGNVQSLVRLIEEDALILDRYNITTNYLETPLHIAAMLNHQQFVVELLKRKPELTKELDSQQSSPLHIAAAKGHVEIVKQLLQIDPDMCYVCDKNGKNPVHIAAMRGRIGVLKELLRVRSDAGRAVVMNGGDQTILHLCVEYSRFEALKVLIEIGDFEDLINCKDKNGNTVLDLAIADKQTKTTELLLGVPGIEVNAMNDNGITELMDNINETQSGVLDGKDSAVDQQETAVYNNSSSTRRKKQHSNKQAMHHIDEKRNALMVVASLIATVAFQAGFTPPTVDTMGDRERALYASFYIFNTISFIASLSIILVLMSGFQLRHRIFVWILIVITWVAIITLAWSYNFAISILALAVPLPSPSPLPSPPPDDSVSVVLGTTILVWMGLMVLLLLAHTIRFIVRMVNMILIRPLMKLTRKKMKIPVHEARV